MAIFQCTVLGTPIPKARARTVRNKYTGKVMSFTPDKTVNYENTIRQQAFDEYAGELVRADVPLILSCDFYLERPKSAPKKRTQPVKHPDGDNLLKSVADALQGIVYERDQQIIRFEGQKHYGLPERTEILVKEYTE